MLRCRGRARCGMRNIVRSRFPRRENMDPRNGDGLVQYFLIIPPSHSYHIHSILNSKIRLKPSPPSKGSPDQICSNHQIQPPCNPPIQTYETNNPIIQFPLINFAIIPRPPSPRRRTAPSRTRRYRPGTYGYPCCAPARTSESEKLSVTTQLNAYQKSTRPRCRFPRG